MSLYLVKWLNNILSKNVAQFCRNFQHTCCEEQGVKFKQSTIEVLFVAPSELTKKNPHVEKC